MERTIRVLIIEDTPDHAELIRLSVSRIRGSEIMIAGRVQDAIELIGQSQFDAIISDLNLPDSDRSSTVQTIKAAAPHTPLLVLTNDAMSSTGDSCIAAGAQDYIRKDALSTTPVDRILSNAIERQRILNENIGLAEELHTKNMQLEIAMNKAEAAVKAKANFLANMSHEIRTPLTSILGFADIAIDTRGVRGDPESTEALSMVKQNCDHLLAVVNDILDVSKVEAGAMKLDLEPSSLSAIVCSVMDVFLPQATGKGLEMSFECSPAVAESLLLDPIRIKQVLINLLGNAVKFTERGSISIRLDSTVIKDNKHWISVDIQDTGIGMDSEELQMIRECNAFTQANSATTRQYGGSGLGLRISQGLAMLMGGSIELDSARGHGSCFTFSFKAIESRPGRVREQDLQGGGPNLQLDGLRVLIADDSRDNQKLFAHYLKRSGATVEYANDGQRCVDRLVDPGLALIDIVLMDIQMPVMDGITAYKTLSALGIQTPVYATSASSTLDDQRAVIEAGFTGFLAKPIDAEALLGIALEVKELKHRRAA